jgi:hypothetical protein
LPGATPKLGSAQVTVTAAGVAPNAAAAATPGAAARVAAEGKPSDAEGDT